jgi:23S rRNA-/tRNA-specific pseudouridylate synthase
MSQATQDIAMLADRLQCVLRLLLIALPLHRVDCQTSGLLLW